MSVGVRVIKSDNVEEFLLSTSISGVRQHNSSKALKKKTLFIALADKSGSMSGNPWKQVQNSLLYIAKTAVENPSRITARIITYNSSAEVLGFNSANYEQKIKDCRSGGGTSFSAAFQALERLLGGSTQQNQKHSNSEYEGVQTVRVQDYDSIIITFLTDGQDGGYGYEAQAQTLKARLQTLPSVVHCVGFSADHNFGLLNEIRMYGKTPGGFRYAEPSDGPQALQAKMEEVFDTAMVEKLKVELQLPQGLHFVRPGDSQQELELREDEDSVSFDVWVTGESNPEQELRVTLQGPQQMTLSTKMATNSNGVTTVFDQRRVELLLIDKLATELSDSVTDLSNKDSQRAWLQRVKAAQEQLSNVNIVTCYDKSLPWSVNKQQRTELIEVRSDVQQKLGSLLSLAADMSTKGSNSVSVIARANDIKFTGQFKKARRQRALDERAISNSANAESLDEQLAAIKLDLEAIGKISKEAREFFVCDISQMSIVDILEDPTEVFGIGLAISRPELAVDDPTKIRIHEVSNTFCLQSCLQDAVKYQLKINPGLADDCFNIDNELDVAFRGKGREPINAWLPLYVNPEHWKRVRVLLKPILGYFCVLNPLGFAWNQMDMPFLVLATMVSRMRAQNTEHQIRILSAMQRTCYQIAVDFQLLPKIKETLSGFLRSAEHRTSDQVPSLLVLVGYLSCLPLADLKEIFGDDHTASLCRFWFAFLEENVRRAVHEVLHGTPEPNILGIINMLMYGLQTEPAVPLENVEDLYVLKGEDESVEFSVENYKFEASETIPPIEQLIPQGVNPRHMDKSDIDVLTKLGKKFLKDYTEKNAGQKLGKVTLSTTVDIELEPQRILSSDTKQSANTLLRQLCSDVIARRGYPRLSGIESSILFTQGWIAYQENQSSSVHGALDEAHGMTSETFFHKMQESFKSKCDNPTMVLKEVLSKCGLNVGSPETIQTLRALLCQACYNHINADARQSIALGTYLDSAKSHSDIFAFFHRKFEEKRSNAFAYAQQKLNWSNLIQTAVFTKNINTYIGLMLYLFKNEDRNEGFKILCKTIQSTEEEVPLLQEKVSVLITGKYDERPIIGMGNPWVPEKDNRKSFIAKLGLESYLDIETLVRGTYIPHVYRESDIPNRHGFCNSCPYVPLEFRDTVPFNAPPKRKHMKRH